MYYYVFVSLCLGLFNLSVSGLLGFLVGGLLVSGLLACFLGGWSVGWRFACFLS